MVWKNSSRQYTQEDIRRKIEAKKECGWEFLFLGANIDAEKEAQKIGIERNRSVTYKNDGKGVTMNYEVVGRTISRAVETTSIRNFISDDWTRDIKAYTEGK